MRTIFALTVFWTLFLSLALASLLAAPSGNKPGVKYLDIATPERVAEAQEMVDKRYQEEAERIAREPPDENKNSTHPFPTKDIVNCGKPQVDKKKFDTAHAIFRKWCDSDDGVVSPFHHQFMDVGDVRIALCNWGLSNPCSNDELDMAWEALGLVCPDQGSAAAGDESIATGMWYRGAWLKGYFRSNCTTGDLCNGDRTGIACQNSD